MGKYRYRLGTLDLMQPAEGKNMEKGKIDAVVFRTTLFFLFSLLSGGQMSDTFMLVCDMED